MVNNVIGVVNYVIAAGSSLLNFMIADIKWRGAARPLAAVVVARLRVQHAGARCEEPCG